MDFSIPIYVEERPAGASQPAAFVVRPLFHPSPIQRSEKLGRALNKLTAELQQLLFQLGREPRHDQLAGWAIQLPFEEVTVDLRLELGSGSKQARFFLAGYPALGRKLFFSPTVPGLHFEVFPNQSVAERATAVFTHYFRNLEKEDSAFNLSPFTLQGKGRLTTVEIAMTPAIRAKKPQPPRRAWMFGTGEKKDGEQELRKTGRSLQSLYPDDLERAVGRDGEVEELARLLAANDRRPILLVGPRKVGKTTILHELAWQMCEKKKEHFGGSREIWLLSPMRLISGMSYLGEWENRVLAILDHARDKDRVLYFDDLIGLLTAGMHSASNLSIAQVLRPALEKRTVRVMAEITPEAWRILRERDRAFADLFHVIPIAEPTEPETFRVLINVARQLEEQYQCEFRIEAVPMAYDLHRRFARDAAFPGKAAGFLRRLAVRHGNSSVRRQHVLDAFCEQSGLQMNFLDSRRDLARPEIISGLAAELAGQGQALGAFADIVLSLKARLNDPRRPLGTLLLLGPTGVGKTQSAKALAKYLFGSADRILRFDMNEYVDGAAADRLAGTFDEPEGLLTGAIRRQPFSVLLFDEIEKAAPEVFDLLLEVLDEGRLTDALGRNADFTNSIILLTSNLGVRESRSKLGFGTGQATENDDAVFVGAAEKFFRPEFFNRLDRVIPFRPLAPAQLETIAKQLIADVFARDGLRRRECLLQVSPGAMERLVALGRHPQLGARALKRVIERLVAQPIAQRLATLPAGIPTIAKIGDDGNQLTLELQELTPVPRSVFWPETLGQESAKRFEQVIEGANAALDRIETELEAQAPTGRIELGNMPPEHARYFACREQLKKLDRIVQAAERSESTPKRSDVSIRAPKGKPAKVVVRQMYSKNPKLDRLRDRAGLELELSEWEAGESVEVADTPLLALCRELSLLQAMVRQPWDDRPGVLLIEAMEAQDANFVSQLAQLYFDFFNNVWGASASFALPPFTPEESLLRNLFGEATPPAIQGVFLKGLNLRFLIPPEESAVLARRADGSLGVVNMRLVEAASATEAEALAQNRLLEGSSVANTTGSVLHLMSQKTITDCRTGLIIPAKPEREEFRALMLSALPLPPEVAF